MNSMRDLVLQNITLVQLLNNDNLMHWQNIFNKSEPQCFENQKLALNFAPFK
jgi:hypothetical protein